MMYDIVTDINCFVCGNMLVERSGPYGNFLGCKNYPKCKNKLKLYKKEELIDKREKVINFIEKITNYKTLEDFFLSRDWKEDLNLCMRLFSFKHTKEDINYFKKNLNNSHRKDKRTVVELAWDLLLGWIIEDCIIEYLQSLFWNIVSNGGDKDRIFSNNKITSDSDFKIAINNKTFLIEQVTAYSNIWKDKQSIDLRDNKYKKLIKHQSYILCIDLKNEKFYFFYVPDSSATRIEHFIPYGGKPVYSVDISLYKENDFDKLNNVLEQTFKNDT